MTCRAIREDAVLAPDNRFVTSLAFDCGVGADQRKEILVIPDLLLGGEPALHDVALGAVRAELTQVNVGVAIGAVLSYIGKDRTRVTLRALDSLMPAAERVLRPVVIEFNNCANRRPTFGAVAILARDRKIAMRIRCGVSLGRRVSIRRVQHKKNHHTQDLDEHLSHYLMTPVRSRSAAMALRTRIRQESVRYLYEREQLYLGAVMEQLTRRQRACSRVGFYQLSPGRGILVSPER